MPGMQLFLFKIAFSGYLSQPSTGCPSHKRVLIITDRVAAVPHAKPFFFSDCLMYAVLLLTRQRSRSLLLVTPWVILPV